MFLTLAQSWAAHFRKETAFDNILVSCLEHPARGVVKPLRFSTAAASAVMVIIHKILPCVLNMSGRKIVKGIHRSLYKNGEMNTKNMRIAAISKDDLMEGVRLQINSNSLQDVKEAYIEKNGQVSVVENKKD
jgi:uncharacterized membrane protein YcaP (DUF421 family)